MVVHSPRWRKNIKKCLDRFSDVGILHLVADEWKLITTSNVGKLISECFLKECRESDAQTKNEKHSKKRLTKGTAAFINAILIEQLTACERNIRQEDAKATSHNLSNHQSNAIEEKWKKVKKQLDSSNGNVHNCRPLPKGITTANDFTKAKSSLKSE